MARRWSMITFVGTTCLLTLAPAAGPVSSGGATDTGPAAGSSPNSGITARVVSVTETRERSLSNPSTSGVSFFTGLRVKLRLEGPAAAGAAKVGRLKLTEAADDAGTDLRDKEQLKWCEQLQDVSRFGQSEKDKSDGAFEYELRLGLPARKAGAIKGVKGELQVVAGGEERIVSVPKARTLAGKTVEDPALKAAGLTLKIVASKPNQKNTIQAELAGDFDAIKEVKVFAPDGTNLLAGSWWSERAGTRSISYMLTRAAEDDDARLELKLAVGQKKLTVPVELANLPLP